MQELRLERRFTRLAIPLLLLVGLPGLANAQGAPAASLNDLALAWSVGTYASPLICRVGDKPVRALRRVEIEPGPKKTVPHIALLEFIDLEAETATRCFTELGGESPNVVGTVEIRHATTRTRDTAMRDFKSELRRRGGFDFEVLRGFLRFDEIREGEDSSEEVDFKGGEMRIRLVREGSDAARLLADLPDRRRLTFEIEAPGGRVLSLPIALLEGH